MIGGGGFGEVCCAALLEQQGDIALQIRLVSLGGKVIMRLSIDDIACQCALGQQGIARDVLAGDVTALKRGDRHTDFVGTLLFIAALYGQCADFFWVWQVFDSCPTTLMMCV